MFTGPDGTVVFIGFGPPGPLGGWGRPQKKALRGTPPTHKPPGKGVGGLSNAMGRADPPITDS